MLSASEDELYGGISSVFNAKTIRYLFRYICDQLIPLICGSDVCPGITILGIGDQTNLHLNGRGELAEFDADAVAKGGCSEPGSM